MTQFSEHIVSLSNVWLYEYQEIEAILEILSMNLSLGAHVIDYWKAHKAWIIYYLALYRTSVVDLV